MALLETEGLEAQYGWTKVLHGIRFAVDEGGITTILIPKENEKDLKEIPPRVLKDLTIIPVEHMDEVLMQALVVDDPTKLFKTQDFKLPPPAAKKGGTIQSAVVMKH